MITPFSSPPTGEPFWTEALKLARSAKEYNSFALGPGSSPGDTSNLDEGLSRSHQSPAFAPNSVPFGLRCYGAYLILTRTDDKDYGSGASAATTMPEAAAEKAECANAAAEKAATEKAATEKAEAAEAAAERALAEMESVEKAAKAERASVESVEKALKAVVNDEAAGKAVAQKAAADNAAGEKAAAEKAEAAAAKKITVEKAAVEIAAV